jgi:hypothetical protein
MSGGGCFCFDERRALSVDEGEQVNKRCTAAYEL